MYYIKNGFKSNRLAAVLAPVFAVCGAIATLFGTGNMMQANQMTLSFKTQFGVPPLVMAIGITFFVALIIQHAFTPIAAAGGFAEATVKAGMQMGFRRGLLTNEAGLGSAPIAHAKDREFRTVTDRARVQIQFLLRNNQSDQPGTRFFLRPDVQYVIDKVRKSSTGAPDECIL